MDVATNALRTLIIMTPLTARVAVNPTRIFMLPTRNVGLKGKGLRNVPNKAIKVNQSRTLEKGCCRFVYTVTKPLKYVLN